MSEKMDYCLYYLRQCSDGIVEVLMRNTDYKTVDSIRSAYEKSSCCSRRNPDYRNRLLVRSVPSFIKQDSERFGCLDADADRVLKRSVERIKNAGTYSDIFKALTDYLWVAASAEICKNRRIISLTDNYRIETVRAMDWINGIKKRIDDEERELSCMAKADDLSLVGRALADYNPDHRVAWYAGNYPRSEIKQMISERRSLIKELEMIYFAFLVTNLYREQLRWRNW